MEHSWSLAVDMHMFVVGLLLLARLPAGPRGVAALCALALVSTTEPPYEGVPAEVFQSGYYATSAFTREAS